MTTPRLTALSATMAKAIVMDVDAWVVLACRAPKAAESRAMMPTRNAANSYPG
jgi:hypothetical protein